MNWAKTKTGRLWVDERDELNLRTEEDALTSESGCVGERLLLPCSLNSLGAPRVRGESTGLGVPGMLELVIA